MTMLALETLPRRWKRDMSRDRIKQEWMGVSDRLRRRWHRLTVDDVSFPGGNAKYLAAVLQERYGMDRREAWLQVYEFESEL